MLHSPLGREPRLGHLRGNPKPQRHAMIVHPGIGLSGLLYGRLPFFRRLMLHLDRPKLATATEHQKRVIAEARTEHEKLMRMVADDPLLSSTSLRNAAKGP